MWALPVRMAAETSLRHSRVMKEMGLDRLWFTAPTFITRLPLTATFQSLTGRNWGVLNLRA
jgi:hypothetical protein